MPGKFYNLLKLQLSISLAATHEKGMMERKGAEHRAWRPYSLPFALCPLRYAVLPIIPSFHYCTCERSELNSVSASSTIVTSQKVRAFFAHNFSNMLK